MKPWIKRILFFSLFVGFLILMNILPFEKWLRPFMSSLEKLGGIGALAFTFIGILMTVGFVPVSIPISLAGFLFGVRWGFLISLGILAGGTLIGTWAGGKVWPHLKEAPIAQRPVFKAVREVLESGSLWMIALLRMTPVLHFMTGNLFLGSLKLKLLPYLGFSLLGMIPGTLLVVIAGFMTRQTLEENKELSLWNLGFFCLGIVIFVLVTAHITRKTQQILKKNH